MAGAGGLLLVMALAARGGRVLGAHRTAEARARQYFLSALDHRARFDAAGMVRDLRAAWTVDPTYLPALIEPILSPPAALAAELDSLATAQPDRALGECIRSLAAVQRGDASPFELPAHATPAARLCAGTHRVRVALRRGEERARADVAWSLWRRFPDSPSLAAQLGAELGASGAWEELISAAVEMADPRRHAFVRLYGYLNRCSSFHRLGRDGEAIRAEREADADTQRSGDGVRLAYLRHLFAIHAGLLRESGGDGAQAAHARAVMAAADEEMTALATRADRVTATGFRLEKAERLLDDGDLAASLREWDALASFADSLGAPDLQARVRVRRGRTLVKLGRTAEAERDLLAGREWARQADHLGWQYEAEHNLLHLYEATGQDAAARRAGEAFVALTQLGGLAPVGLMAHHDLAWFYLRRGERERARPQFEAVLAFADSLAGFDYWAGEYFELTGDLDRAEAYFRGAKGGGYDIMRAYAGLVRMAEATGDIDRAIQYAREHDEAGESAHYPEFAPLLPGILARHGRFAEATTRLAPARDRADGRGQVAAWASLSVELAELMLRQGNLSAAASVADSAAEAGARVAAVEVGLRARSLAGLARVRMGGPAVQGALSDIRAALRRAEGMHAPQLVAELHGRYGEALAAADRFPCRSMSSANSTDSVAQAATWPRSPARSRAGASWVAAWAKRPWRARIPGRSGANSG